jgi:hypothetical protein
VWRRWLLGGGLKGDAPAGEVFELADEVALPAPAGDPGFVVSRASQGRGEAQVRGLLGSK